MSVIDYIGMHEFYIGTICMQIESELTRWFLDIGVTNAVKVGAYKKYTFVVWAN